MVIVGAGGLAKEVIEIFAQQNALTNLYFFDNLSPHTPGTLYDKFPILTSIDQVKKIFKETGDTSFTLGLGSPAVRVNLSKLFEQAGGKLVSAVSNYARVGSFGNSIGQGCTVLDGAVITNSVTIGKGCLINPHVSISHDSRIGEFVEISPGARVTGGCSVGDYCVLGTNAVILPRIILGKNVVVGAGAVVTKNVPDNSLVAGVPAALKKELPPVVH